VLAILDIATKKTTDYCLSTDPYATNGRFVQSLSAPLWSPDGSKILIEHRTANTAYYVVLVDVQKNIAFQFAQNMFPFGWMIKTP